MLLAKLYPYLLFRNEILLASPPGGGNADALK